MKVSHGNGKQYGQNLNDNENDNDNDNDNDHEGWGTTHILGFGRREDCRGHRTYECTMPRLQGMVGASPYTPEMRNQPLRQVLEICKDLVLHAAGFFRRALEWIPTNPIL